MEVKEKKIKKDSNIKKEEQNLNKCSQQNNKCPCDKEKETQQKCNSPKCECSEYNYSNKKNNCSEQECDSCSPILGETKEKEDKLKKIITKLENQNKQLQKDLSQINQNLHNDKLKHQADLDNFQKRIKKENDNFLKYSSMNLISNLLVPLEQLQQVLEISHEEPLLKNFLSGFKMINQQIKDILNKEGVQEIKALGEKFDPKIHHAIEKTSNKNEPNGINVAVLQKGYLYKDLIIKPAMVKVNIME